MLKNIFYTKTNLFKWRSIKHDIQPIKVLKVFALSRSFNAFSKYPDQPRPSPKKEGDG